MQVSADGTLTLARRWPPRMDVAADAAFPPLRPAALAHEIRKDLWRAVRDLRGASPVIAVRPTAHGLSVRAGLRCDEGMPPGLRDRLERVLSASLLRRRWCNHARTCRS